jgi:hypothetical protein
MLNAPENSWDSLRGGLQDQLEALAAFEKSAFAFVAMPGEGIGPAID